MLVRWGRSLVDHFATLQELTALKAGVCLSSRPTTSQRLVMMSDPLSYRSSTISRRSLAWLELSASGPQSSMMRSLTRAMDRSSLVVNFARPRIDNRYPLARQGSAPCIVEKQSLMFDRCLRLQPFKPALARVSARQWFKSIGNTDPHQSQTERLRCIRHQSGTRGFHFHRLLPVEQFPVKNPTGEDTAKSNTVVLVQIGDRLRNPSGVEVISRGDKNNLEWSSQSRRHHIFVQRCPPAFRRSRPPRSIVDQIGRAHV